ncbi:MAG: PfkB family carbohydrate kinase [Parabacteroides sp.]|nr:PfkB family carbohydrate kinase [Parabacteroides sp.]
MGYTNRIVVIGGVHLDILTNYIDNTANTNFRDGTISIGIGGVGFNITANLKYNNFINARLFTVINNPEESFSGMLIQDALRKRGMLTEYVKIDNRDFVSEIGFIGVMNGRNDFEFGITFTGIDSFDFNERDLENAITDSEVVVIDCNLESIQINTIREFCRLHDKPLFICSVSENRVARALKFESKKNFIYKAFSLNRNEVRKAVEQQPKLHAWESFHKKSDIKSLCNFFHTEHLIITSGQEHYIIFSSSGNRKDGCRFNIPGVISTLGADDALFAAIVAYYTKHQDFNWDKCQDMMRTFLTKVLRSHTTTPAIEKKRSCRLSG